MKDGDVVKVRTDGGYILKCIVISPIPVEGKLLVRYPNTGARVWVALHEIVK